MRRTPPARLGDRFPGDLTVQTDRVNQQRLHFVPALDGADYLADALDITCTVALPHTAISGEGARALQPGAGSSMSRGGRVRATHRLAATGLACAGRRAPSA